MKLGCSIYPFSYTTLSLLVLIVVLAILCITSVDTGEIAVVTEFGKIKSVETAGVHVRAPWANFNKMNVTQQQIEDEYSTATKDSQSITQKITAQIIVKPDKAKELYKSFLNNHINDIVTGKQIGRAHV